MKQSRIRMDMTTSATHDARSRLLRELLDASREGLLAADARSATLLSNAGFALRQAKKADGNGDAFYNNNLAKDVQHRAMLENGLRRAVRDGE